MKKNGANLTVLSFAFFIIFSKDASSGPAFSKAIAQGLNTRNPKPHITDEDYETFSDAVRRITDKYPPTQHAYLGIGRSPAPIMRFFYELGLRNHGSIPMSQLRTLTVYREDELAPIREKIFHYFDYTFRSPGRFQNLTQEPYKKLVLIDYVDSGGALQVMRGFLAEYFKGHQITIEVITVGLTGDLTAYISNWTETLRLIGDYSRGIPRVSCETHALEELNRNEGRIRSELGDEHESRLRRLTSKGIDELILLPSSVNHKFFEKLDPQNFAQYSEYGQFDYKELPDVSEGGESAQVFKRKFEKRGAYDAFGAALRKKMIKDSRWSKYLLEKK